MKSNIALTFVRFLKELDAKVTKTSAMEYIETHPEQGTLLSISEGLEHWNIETAAIRITEEQLVEMPTPFITFFKRNGGTFGVVKSYKDGMLEWYDTNKGIVNQAWSEFQQDWSGVVLLAETNETSGEKGYQQKVNQEFLSNIRVPLGLSLVALAFVGIWFLTPYSFGFYANALLLLKAIGAVLSVLLLVKSANTENEFVNKLCNVGAKVSCQSILDSPAAKLTSWLSLSDIGFVYFFGSLLTVFFVRSELQTFYSYHLISSCLSLIFCSYSIYYQSKIVKMWCPICLGVVFVLILEAILMFQNRQFDYDLSLSFAISVTLSFFIPTSFLLLYSKELSHSKERDDLKTELGLIKSNPKVVEALLTSQKRISMLPKGIGIVELGNKSADNVLTLISNPLCNPCSRMHLRVVKLLETTQNLKCNIIFRTNDDHTGVGAKLIRKILSLPSELQSTALHEWYTSNDRNFEKWNRKYLSFKVKEVGEIFRQDQEYWCDKFEIKETPTILYNSIVLPRIIQIEDLKYFSSIRIKV